MNVVHTIFLIALIFISIRAVPPEECFADFNWADCGGPPTPVAYYWKPGSRCEVAIWRGCMPNVNMFKDESDCVHTCIFRERAEWDGCDQNNKIDEFNIPNTPIDVSHIPKTTPEVSDISTTTPKVSDGNTTRDVATAKDGETVNGDIGSNGTMGGDGATTVFTTVAGA